MQVDKRKLMRFLIVGMEFNLRDSAKMLNHKLIKIPKMEKNG